MNNPQQPSAFPAQPQAHHAVRLVHAHDEVPSSLFRKRPLQPAGIAVVCLLADGRLVPAPQLGAMGRYRRRYDVNIADHFHSEAVTLPARNDAFEFQGVMDIGWRVTDPVKVVARNVVDGLALVRSTLLAEMRQISRRYPVEQCADADEEVNRTLGAGPRDLPEGITVHRFAARLTLDETTRRLLQEHRNTGYESEIEQRRIEATRRALDGDNALLVLHLTKHKEDTASLITMIAQDRHSSEQRRMDLLRDLVERKIIQDVDLDDFSRTLIQQSTTSLAGGYTGPPQLNGPRAVGPAPVVNAVPVVEAPAVNGPAVNGPGVNAHGVAAPAPQPGRSGPQESKGSPSGGVTGWKPVGDNK
ncbi:hypothetical protein [Saccharothrix hoggarensis]|uniref:SPFH domain/Band 7 family protein n=1 Tax=Saccharothrix hoggarensis TaxID=913853 RepID=A0ABW3R3A8_9PSEU